MILLTSIDDFEVTDRSVTAWFLGGVGLGVKTSETMIYIDPYFGYHESLQRMIAVPIEPSLIKRADLVLLTHEHEDHCDKGSLAPIYRNTNATFVGPKPAFELMTEWGFAADRMRQIQDGSMFSLNDVNIHALEGNDPLSKGALMYVIQTPGGIVFHGGDAWYFGGFAEVGKKWSVDLAFISCGKNPPYASTPSILTGFKKLYMNPCEFLEAARDLNAKKAIPMHWDIWKHSFLEPTVIQRVASEWMPDVDVHIMRLGDRITSSK